MEKFNILINEIPYEVSFPDYTLLQMCEGIGHSIPRFCYHEELSIAGNCRMCLVELEGSNKPVVACSTSLEPEMKFFTNNDTVKIMRESVLEFLLINHPLDCPICDQGGECDLQDQTMIFGSDRGRFIDIKRSVEDKNFGPFIKTIMTRCIHCTRCVRYFEEVIGSSSLGTMGRGKDTEISTYTFVNILDEVSGNVIDLCPVGALTSRPYAFTARPWELVSYESIDVLDSLNSNLRVDIKGNIIMRILPKVNKYLNEEWITDFVRFSYDGIRNERLTFPLLKVIKHNNILFEYSSWDIIFSKLTYWFRKNDSVSTHFYVGNNIDLFSAFLLKYWIDTTNNFIFSYFDSLVDSNLQTNFLISESIHSIFKSSNFLILQLDLKKHISVLNIRLKKLKWKYHRNINVYYVGSNTLFNYKYKHLGLSNIILLSILKGKHFFCNNLIKNKFNFIKNANLKFKVDSFNKYSSLSICNNLILKSELIHYNYIGLNNHSILNNNYLDNNINYLNLYYLINYNKYIDFNSELYYYVVYQGTHGSYTAMNSNLILPSLCSVEYQGLFMNLEGKLQSNIKMIYGPGVSLSLSDFLKKIIIKPYLIEKMNIDFLNDLFNCYIGYVKSYIPFKEVLVNTYQIADYNNSYYYNKYSYDKLYFSDSLYKSKNFMYFKKIFKKNYNVLTLEH